MKESERAALREFVKAVRGEAVERLAQGGIEKWQRDKLSWVARAAEKFRIETQPNSEKLEGIQPLRFCVKCHKGKHSLNSEGVCLDCRILACPDCDGKGWNFGRIWGAPALSPDIHVACKFCEGTGRVG